MQTETAALLAVVAAPVAVVIAIGAAAAWRVARHASGGLRRAADRLERLEPSLRSQVAAADAALDRARAAIAVLDDRRVAQDRRLESWVRDLSATRSTVHAVSRNRVGPAVHALRVAGALARVAALWRTPVR